MMRHVVHQILTGYAPGEMGRRSAEAMRSLAMEELKWRWEVERQAADDEFERQSFVDRQMRQLREPAAK